MLDREIERNRVGFLLGEVCAMLCAVEDDEEHVSRSECVVPISTGGNNWWGHRTPTGRVNGLSRSSREALQAPQEPGAGVHALQRF
jgi:hypothetical protein